MSLHIYTFHCANRWIESHRSQRRRFLCQCINQGDACAFLFNTGRSHSSRASAFSPSARLLVDVTSSWFPCNFCSIGPHRPRRCTSHGRMNFARWEGSQVKVSKASGIHPIGWCDSINPAAFWENSFYSDLVFMGVFVAIVPPPLVTSIPTNIIFIESTTNAVETACLCALMIFFFLHPL